VRSGRDTFAIYNANLLARSALVALGLKYLRPYPFWYVLLATALTWLVVQAALAGMRKARLTGLLRALFGEGSR